MEPQNQHGGRVEDLLSDLQHAARIPTKQRGVNISVVRDRLCSRAREYGLSETSLSTLIDLITLPNELDQGSITNIIGNLYPAGKVSDNVVIRIVGSLGHGKAKPSYATQAALLKWFVMAHDALENPKILSRLYAVLFNLLDTIALRAPLCHVLSLITRRRHVKPYRIQVLMELTRQTGNEPPLVGLMRVYKDYYPDIIVGDVVSGRASVFKHPDPEWRHRLGEIQEIYIQQNQSGSLSRGNALGTLRNTSRSSGRNSSSVIPVVHTFHAVESSITLEEIEDVEDLVQKLEKIAPPNQVVAVIGSPILQIYLHLRSSVELAHRVDAWLMAFFEDQLQDTDETGKDIVETLEAVRSYAHYTKHLPPTCMSYLNSMVFSWNGTTGREVILDLLAYAPLETFEGRIQHHVTEFQLSRTELYRRAFQPMEDAVLEDSKLESKIAVLHFYTTLLDRWTVTLLSQPIPDLEAAAAVTSLIEHVNILSLTILQTSQSVDTCSSILSFYESAATLISYPALTLTARIATPPAELVYTLHFSSSLSTLSRLCAILALYKRAFEIAMAPKTQGSAALRSQSYPKEYVNHFNGFLMDVCNCLWRARSLNKTDPNALGCLVPSSVTAALTKYVASLDSSFTLPALFGFSTSPVFCSLAISYVRELEDAAIDNIDKRHAGPVTQSSLKQLESDGGVRLAFQDYKLGVLQYMENKGAGGVGELMYNTMKHLMAARNKNT